ncbi:MAG: hypothetical protein JWR26_1566 [Pedosphaera sp.]|nr:hypothetical protein [Pedosphaera sp.]
MKKMFVLCAWCVLSARAPVGAQEAPFTIQVTTNREHLKTATNMGPQFGTRTNLGPAGPSKVKQPKPIDSVGTNTPAWEAQAVSLMLAQANLTRTNWGLELPHELSTNDVAWYVYPALNGPHGNIATTDGRYLWLFMGTQMYQFDDHDYFGRRVAYSGEEGARLAKITSKITKAQAQKIAEDALHGLGFTTKLLHLQAQPKVTQFHFVDGGRDEPLPLFRVNWKNAEDPTDNLDVEMQVSGIIKKVISYSNFVRETPPLPIPNNYFELLGVNPPQNERQRMGLERLTPLPAK